MDKLFDKLSIYDFFGYIIPGFMGTWALSVLFVEVLGTSFFIKLDDGIINSIIFVAISYYIGVILHEISEIFQQHLFKRLWKGMPSEKFLQDTDKKYSADFKKKLKSMIEEKFGLEVDNTPIKNQEAFNLVYSSLQVTGKDGRVQVFNALYGMYRNFFAGTILCLLIYITKASIILYKQGWTPAISSVAYTAMFLLCGLILLRRVKRFSERLVDYVYRDYYTVYKEN